MQGKGTAKVFCGKVQLGRSTRIGNGPVELVGSDSLIRALQIRQVEGLLALVAQDIGVILQHRGIFGQRTRLVHAHHVHGTQRFHGVDVLNNDLLVF